MIKIREECSGVVMLQIGCYCNNYLIETSAKVFLHLKATIDNQ